MAGTDDHSVIYLGFDRSIRNTNFNLKNANELQTCIMANTMEMCCSPNITKREHWQNDDGSDKICSHNVIVPVGSAQGAFLLSIASV